MKFFSIKLLMLGSLMLSSAAALANTCGSVCDDLYIIAGVGGSFSRCADIRANDNFWNTAEEGYNADLGRSEMYNIGIGYAPCPLWRLTVEGSFRPSFKYCKFQTAEPAGDILFPLGNRTRIFALNNKSLLFNGYIYGAGIADCLNWEIFCNTFIQPYIGGGVGVAYNRIGNFHTVLSDTVASGDLTLNVVRSAMHSLTKRSLAWQFTAGIELAHSSFCSVDIAYRYFSAGNLRTNNWVTVIDEATTAPAWCGKLRANEVFVNFNIFKSY